MAKDLKAYDEDLYLRGDGVAQRHVRLGRQDGVIKDLVTADVPEYNFAVDGKRVGVEEELLADMAALNTTNLNERIVSVAGKLTATDGLGGQWRYYSTGRSGVTVDGYEIVASTESGNTDGYYQRLKRSSGLPAFDTIATIKASTALADGYTYTVRGYSSVGDGGGGQFTYKESATDTANEGTVIAVTAGGRLFREWNGRVCNPRWFGAADATDSTAAINAALTLADVVIRRSDFRITGTLSVPANRTIRGVGAQSKITQSAIGHNLMTIGGDGATVDGIHLIGAGETADTFDSTDHGIYASNVKNLTVTNSHIESCLGSGIDSRNVVNATYTDNWFYRNRWGTDGATESDIKFYGSTTSDADLVRLTGNRCYSNNSQGIFIAALAGTTEVICQGNICVTLDPATCIEGGDWSPIATPRRRHGIILGYSSSSKKRSLVSGNICGNALWTGIYCQGDTSAGVSIVGNYVYECGDISAGGLTGGIWVNCHGKELVSGNVIESCGSQGISLRGDGTTVGVTLVSGNKIRMPSGSENGIFVQIDPTKIQIVNNSVHREDGAAEAAIRIEPSDATAMQLDIKGNILEGFANGIYLANDVSNDGVMTLVESNTIRSCTTGVYYQGGLDATRIKVQTNILDSCTTGIYVNGLHSGRVLSGIKANLVSNCTTAYDVAGNTSDTTVIVESPVFGDGITNKAQSTSSSGFDCLYFADPADDGSGDLFRFLPGTNAKPTAGTFVRGDLWQQENGTVAFCREGGTPGEWQTGVVKTPLYGLLAGESSNTAPDGYEQTTPISDPTGIMRWDLKSAATLGNSGATPSPNYYAIRTTSGQAITFRLRFDRPVSNVKINAASWDGGSLSVMAQGASATITGDNATVSDDGTAIPSATIASGSAVVEVTGLTREVRLRIKGENYLAIRSIEYTDPGIDARTTLAAIGLDAGYAANTTPSGREQNGIMSYTQAGTLHANAGAHTDLVYGIRPASDGDVATFRAAFENYVDSVKFTLSNIEDESIVLTAAKPITVSGAGLTITNNGTTSVTVTSSGTERAATVTIDGEISEFSAAVTGSSSSQFVGLPAVEYRDTGREVPKTFDTIADIKAAGLVDGKTYTVRGISAVEDGGGGSFVFDSASTDTADEEVIYAVTAGGRLYRQGVGQLQMYEASADPANPTEGRAVVWQSDGTGSGDDGDLMAKITAGGVTKTVTIVDFSAS